MRKAIAAALTAAMVVAGCGAGAGIGGADDCVKPTIAVMKFENRAPFPMGWNLGDGMAEVLVDRLLATGRYHVVERPDIAAVLREIQFQQSGATRRQGRTSPGQIKNVQYLVKGVVTDFGHVSSSSGFFDGGGWLIGGSGSRAVMGITLQVVDVESGEVIESQSISESVKANDLEVKATYRGVAFGGQSFYRTPLGKATGKVIGKAVRRVTGAIANRPWEPKVAQVTGEGLVVINGGRDRRVEVGAEYAVVAAGAPIVDPDSGDLLGRHPGRALARVRITQVHPRYSVGEIVSGAAGDIEAGQQCQLAAACSAGRI